jgi:hypothetical protein
MGTIYLLPQRRKRTRERLFYSITYSTFTQSETDPLDNRDLQCGDENANSDAISFRSFSMPLQAMATVLDAA